MSRPSPVPALALFGAGLASLVAGAVVLTVSPLGPDPDTGQKAAIALLAAGLVATVAGSVLGQRFWTRWQARGEAGGGP